MSCRHGPGSGSYDETARRASHEELASAMLLVREGHDVRTVAERRGSRTPDLVACLTPVEVKSFLPLAERSGRPPTPEGFANKLLVARGQGAQVIIWGKGKGLSQSTAQAGYGLFCKLARESGGAGLVRAVRVLGDGYDLSYKVPADLRAASPGRRPRLAP